MQTMSKQKSKRILNLRSLTGIDAALKLIVGTLDYYEKVMLEGYITAQKSSKSQMCISCETKLIMAEGEPELMVGLWFDGDDKMSSFGVCSKCVDKIKTQEQAGKYVLEQLRKFVPDVEVSTVHENWKEIFGKKQ